MLTAVEEVWNINSLELLSNLINEEWNKLVIMYSEPWGIPWVVPPHERDDYEIHFIEQGSGSFSVGDRVYNVNPGDVIVLHSMEGNSFRADAEPFRLLYVTFSFSRPANTQKIKELNVLLREESFPLQLNETSNIRKMLYTMHREIIAKSIGHDLRIKMHLGMIIMEILDTWNQEKSLEGIRHMISSNSHKLVNKVIVYLQDNYNSDVKLEAIGKMINLHPRYLCTLFRQITGKTIIEFLRHFRIEKAKRLLLYTSLPITEIAYEVGYNNSQYFSKIFSQVEGMEPRAFRRQGKMYEEGINAGQY